MTGDYRDYTNVNNAIILSLNKHPFGYVAY
jgi:hypothetical protein